MKKCPGTFYTDCKHPLLKRGEKLCKKCICDLKELGDKMSGINEFRLVFVGHVVDVDGLSKSGWINQDSPQYPYIIAKEPGLWVKLVKAKNPAQISYFMITIAKSGRISAMDLGFFSSCYSDGAMHTDMGTLGEDEKLSLFKILNRIIFGSRI